jgi:ribA/ribD-fused uncharacterized protein
MRIFLLWAALAAGAGGAAAATPSDKPAAWGDVFPGVVQDLNQIHGFAGDYRWLSNFFPCPVVYEGLAYGSSEAAYQSAKFPLAERKVFTTLQPDAAKKLAHSKTFSVEATTAWDARKDRVMREILWAKFSQNPALGRQLVATGKKDLQETNWWDDEYWGVYQGKGKNTLGVILMETRARLVSTPAS